MAGLPNHLTEKPRLRRAADGSGAAAQSVRAVGRAGAMRNPAPAGPSGADVLSDVLQTIRLAGSLQFCFISNGDWETGHGSELGELGAGVVMPFHIIVEGRCWMVLDGVRTELEAGDVVAFPFASGHQLGAGRGGSLVSPTAGLPPRPWRDLPIVRHGDPAAGNRVRILCGFLQCDSLGFRPLREALPVLIHVRTRGANDGDGSLSWLRATVSQIIAEAEMPRAGSRGMLERLTEILFIELLRHRLVGAGGATAGWLAALGDPALSRCLSLIHEAPRRDWSVQQLAAASGLSRSVLAERFETVLGTSPMRYVRDWRLCLASVALGTTRRTIAAIAEEAGYGTEAAFNRAFSRTYGIPPAAWRQKARRQA